MILTENLANLKEAFGGETSEHFWMNREEIWGKREKRRA